MPKGIYIRTKPVWNLGLTADTDERVRKYTQKKIGVKRTELLCLKLSERMKELWRSGGYTGIRGKTMSNRGRRNLSLSHIGKPSAIKGMHWNEESKNRGKGDNNPLRKKWLEMDDNQRRDFLKSSFLSGRKSTKPEMILDIVLQKFFPNEWEYVGDGKFIIGGKNPDFVNVNGKKKIIELNGVFWHKDQNPQDRIDLFKQYGFETLIITDEELYEKPAEIYKKIKQFCKQ